MAQTMDVSNLVDYVEQNKQDIIHASVLGAQTLTYPIDIITGVKYQEQFNFMAITAPFQSGATCAFNSSGTTTFTKTVLTVLDVKVQQDYCPKQLEAKYTQKFLRPGAHQEELPLAQFITDYVNQLIAAQMEQAIWQGDTTNPGMNNLKHFDGLIKKIDAASPVYATATAAISKANVLGVIEEMYTLIPAQILNKELVLIVGKSTFQKINLALAALNYFHVPVSVGMNQWEMTYPYFNLKVVAVDGLSNITGTAGSYKDRMVLTYWDNLAFVTDLQNDSETVELWYSSDDRVIKTSYEWKAGTGVKFGSEIVTYKNS